MLNLNDEKFNTCLDFTLKEEGGYSNNPDDHGGPTKAGITQADFTRWLTLHQLPERPVHTASLDEIRAIYEEFYYIQIGCDRLQPAWALLMFDTHVLCGPGYARTWYAVARGSIDRFVECREHHHMFVASQHPSQRQFLHDWLGRCARLLATAKKLAQ